jgi:hypothetical protein
MGVRAVAPIVISTFVRLYGTSAMRCCAGFFMGNSLSDPEDLLIPFAGTQSLCGAEYPVLRNFMHSDGV